MGRFPRTAITLFPILIFFIHTNIARQLLWHPIVHVNFDAHVNHVVARLLHVFLYMSFCDAFIVCLVDSLTTVLEL